MAALADYDAVLLLGCTPTKWLPRTHQTDARHMDEGETPLHNEQYKGALSETCGRTRKEHRRLAHTLSNHICVR